MRFIFRGIALGLLAGTLLFFFPFLLRFLLFFLLISFIIRVVFGWGWRRRRYYGRNFFYQNEGPYNDAVISIDGRGYAPPVRGGGPESRFPIQ